MDSKISIFEYIGTTTLAICLFSLIIYQMIKIYFEYRKKCKIINLIPGPPTIPLLGNSLSFIGDRTVLLRVLQQWTEQYGTPFRIWFGFSPMVIIDEPEDVQLVLTKYRAAERSELSTRMIYPITGDGLIAINSKKSKTRRRLILPTFINPVLESFVPIFVAKSKILSQCIERHVENGVFDISTYLCKQSLDTICASAMGVETNCQTHPNEYPKVARNVLELAAQRFVKIWLFSDTLFYCSSYGRELKREVKIIKSFAEEILKNRKSMIEKNKTKCNGLANDMAEGKRPHRKAFLDHCIEIVDRNPDFSEQDLLAEINTILLAGFDTTAVTNGFTLLMLAIHQDVQQESYNEIYNIFGESDRDITLDDLSNLRYLEMVIKETLRMYPTLHMVERDCDQDYKLSKYTIPKGSTIAVSLKTLHMNPKHWQNPEIFDPLRFLPEEVQKRHSHCFLPFITGPRNCIGSKYAMMSMKVTIATLLRKYYFTTNIEQKDIKLETSGSLRSTIGYPIELHARQKLSN